MTQHIDDHDVIEAMRTYGGSFVKALASAWSAGDAINQAKLKAAFPEYWDEYRELVSLQRARA